MLSTLSSLVLLALALSCCMGASRSEATGRLPIEVLAPSKPMRVNSLTSKDVLVVISTSVGSIKQTETQLNTFGRHFPIVIVTEEHVNDCVFCGNMDGTETHKGSFFDVAQQTRFDKRPVGWYCARKMQYLQVVLEQIPQLPLYLLIIDPDTFVHPLAILKVLSSSDASHPRILGSAYEGGAGYLFNQQALERLKSEAPVANMVWDRSSSTWVKRGPQATLLGVCLHRGLGGSWCYMHDDHFVGACANAADIPMKKLQAMHMVCKVGTFNDALRPPSVWLHNSGITNWIKSDVMTCHYTDSETMLSMYKVITDKHFASFIL